jgi:hypothetical protein
MGLNRIPTETIHIGQESEAITGACNLAQVQPFELHSKAIGTRMIPFVKKNTVPLDGKDFRPISIYPAERKLADNANHKIAREWLEMHMESDQ